MRLLFLGDIVGRTGRKAVVDALPGLRRRYALDFVIINGENAAGGFGITEAILEELIEAGADAVTLGNHAFDQKDALVFIERYPQLIRPINYPKGTPGRGASLIKTPSRADVLVINAMGRIFMTEIDDPFRAIDAELTACRLKQGADAIFIDFHAEATSEKQALGYFRRRARHGRRRHAYARADRGRARAAERHGLHVRCRHVRRLQFRARHGHRGADQPLHHQDSAPALRAGDGPATISGLAVDIDDKTGLATNCGALRIGPHLEPAAPAFWDA